MKGQKETSEEGRDLKITILVSEEERKRIRKAALEDKKGRSVSTIGRDLLLDYAERMEKKNPLGETESRTLTERVERESPEKPEEITPEPPSEYMEETPIEDIEEPSPEPPKAPSKKGGRRKAASKKAPSENPKEEKKIPEGYREINGIMTSFSDRELSETKEKIEKYLEGTPRKAATIWKMSEDLGIYGGLIGDTIGVYRDTFDYERIGEKVSLRHR